MSTIQKSLCTFKNKWKAFYDLKRWRDRAVMLCIIWENSQWPNSWVQNAASWHRIQKLVEVTGSRGIPKYGIWIHTLDQAGPLQLCKNVHTWNSSLKFVRYRKKTNTYLKFKSLITVHHIEVEKNKYVMSNCLTHFCWFQCIWAICTILLKIALQALPNYRSAACCTCEDQGNTTVSVPDCNRMLL